MSAKVLEGPAVASAINEELSSRVEDLKAKGVDPTLAIIRVGERPDDVAYERGAAKRAEGIGISVERVLLPSDASREEVLSSIESANEDPRIHGLLVLRPLPDHIDDAEMLERILPSKDVDSGTVAVLSSVFVGEGLGFAPCTAQACMEILDHYGIDAEGRHAVVVGRSLVVGKPVSMMLLDRNATVTIAHSRTADLPSLTRQADIVVACVGRPEMLDAKYFSEGQVVLDVGINFTEAGRMVGDVNFAEASEVVEAITPVPRGVGSVTTSVLCKHVVEAAEAMA